MEENKLLNQIKSAAENAESKDFPGMEKVWNRVEEKLDNKADKKAVWRWKKIAVAASLLFFGVLGYQFLKNNPNIKTNEVVTANDSVKVNPAADKVVTAEPNPKLNPLIKPNANLILQKQIQFNSAAVAASTEAPPLNFTLSTDSISSKAEAFYWTTPAAGKQAGIVEKEDYKLQDKKDQSSEVELFVEKGMKKSNAQKEEPLVIVDDKVSKKNIKEMEFTDGDSLIVLKEPLYIINGVEYTEQEVFGPNPTSPYTPLNKQEIETISILQDEKAVEIYGNKGKKGIVIITTKSRKPVNANVTKAKK